jgi:hypothetical protein
LQKFLTPFRLPRALLMKVEGYDGDANAFYEKHINAPTLGGIGLPQMRVVPL